MGIFNTIRRAFGFGGDDEDEVEENIYPDASVKVSPARPQVRSTSSPGPKKHATPEQNNSVAPQSSHDIALKIFDGVVEIFNEALPSFLAKSVDPEAQKRILLESIDEGVRRHIENMHAMAVEECSRQWADEKNSLHAEMKAIDTKSKEMETRTNEMREKQLSAERQKRALAERVHDLESNVAKLEAEKEQYELEVKSMMNKMKVASVHEKEVEDLRNELNNLRARALSGGEPIPAVNTEELANANKAIEELKESITAKDAELSKLKGEIEDLTTEKSILEEAVSTLEMKDKMAASMVNEMQSQSSDNRRQVEETKKELNDAHKRIETLEQRLKEAENVVKEIEEVSNQIDKFQEVKDKLEGRIASLKESLQKEKDDNAELRSTIESLNATIRQNLEQHAIQQSEMHAEIDTLKSDAATRSAAKPRKEDKPSRRKRERNFGNELPIDNDTSDIDSILGDTNWLVSQPPENHSMRPDTSEPTNDFGYQEPPRRHTNIQNDAQMSLF